MTPVNVTYSSPLPGLVIMATVLTGSCSACRYEPVAFDARDCPHCGARNPNPGVGNRFAGRGMLIGLFAGVTVGAVAGWLSGRPYMAFGGGLVGAIPGLFVGLVIALILAAAYRLSGRR